MDTYRATLRQQPLTQGHKPDGAQPISVGDDEVRALYAADGAPGDRRSAGRCTLQILVPATR